ncbi:site-specific integrase [Streptomyces sp. NPDC091217]|uniref:site-specific integrase n=1 Tax=Streptomyces sp. NPDC091217 TaxID=3365975 RepID=UPI00382BB276
MSLFIEVDRDLRSIQLPQWGRVVRTDDVIPFMVLDPQGRPVEPIRRFLRDFLARGHSVGSVRSYAFDLHRWWRFLRAIDVPWDKVTSAEVRDFVLWMGQAEKQRRSPRTKSAATAGQVNAVTRKQNLGDLYSARTIRHSNAVLRCFYEFVIDAGDGPLVNPVRRDRTRGRRANAHHNPLEPFRAGDGCATTPSCPGSGPGRCQTSVGTSCSRQCARTATERSSPSP